LANAAIAASRAVRGLVCRADCKEKTAFGAGLELME
jgi:hypothetical protein